MKLWDAIMIGTVALGALLLAMTDVSYGGDIQKVPLPDLSTLNQTQAQELAREVAEANVITSNCPDYDISDGEWTLLTGTGDLLTQRLGLDAAGYERDYMLPAFSLLDDPTACDRIGPTTGPLIGRLVAMGGSVTLQ